MKSIIETLTSIKFSYFWTTVWFVVSLVIAYKANKPELVGGAGAMITLAGILLTTRSLLAADIETAIAKEMVDPFRTAVDISDPDHREKSKKIKEEAALNVKSAHTGFKFLIVGTIIWAYGSTIYDCFL